MNPLDPEHKYSRNLGEDIQHLINETGETPAGEPLIGGTAPQAAKDMQFRERLSIQDQAIPSQSTVVRPIRTLKTDVEESVQSGSLTLSRMAAAQAQERREQGPSDRERRSSRRAIVLGLAALLLVFGGATAGVYVWYTAPAVNPAQEESSFIFTEQQKDVNTSGMSAASFKTTLIQERDTLQGQLGDIERILPVKDMTAEDGTVTRGNLTLAEFFTTLSIAPPNNLIRALDPSFVYGIHIFDGNQPFLLAHVTSYENAYRGMLDWENRLERDMGLILRRPQELYAGTSTPLLYTARPFKDLVIKNKDVRAIENEAGNPILFWTITPDRQYLIITTNKETFGLLVTRLASTRVAR